MRTAEERSRFYHKKRGQMLREQKKLLSCFEGQKWFRFENSWRRISGSLVLILNDDSEVFTIDGPGGITPI